MRLRLGLGALLFFLGCPTQPVRVDPSIVTFHQIRLLTPEDKEIDFGDFYGKIAFVDFFSSHCMPCLYSIPRLNRLHQELRMSGFSVVGIALDTQVKPILRPFLAMNPTSYPIAVADTQIFQGKTTLGPIKTVPLQILLDRCGRAHKVYQGILSFDLVKQDIRALLASKADAACLPR